MISIMTQLATERVIAIIRLDDLRDAEALASALIAGGVRILEFTLTSPDALAALDRVQRLLGDSVQIGIGSVTTPEQAQTAIDGGASFIVTPILQPDVITLCRAAGVPVIAGAYTPTEIFQAHMHGADAVKVFPARSLGAAYIRDVLAPLPELRLVPTGGINADNAANYLRAGAFAVGVGGKLVDPNHVAEQDWQAITRAASELIAVVRP